MFHAHKTEFAELGWMGFFGVGGEAARRAAAFCEPRDSSSAGSVGRDRGPLGGG